MKSILYAAVTATAVFTALAATAQAGTTLSADKRFTIYESAPTHYTAPFYHPSAKTTIFSNLGTKYPKGVYYPAFGYTVSGSGSIVGLAAWAAMAFVPAAGGTITEIATGVGFGDGANEVQLVLYSDAGGIPGAPIRTWTFKNLPKLGECCTLIVGKDKAGIPVTAGTQYWAGVKPVQKAGTTYASWATNTTDEVDPQLVAGYVSGSWAAQESGNVPALGIFGN